MITISISRDLRPMSDYPPTTAPVLAFRRSDRWPGLNSPDLLFTNGQQWFFDATRGTAHADDFHGWIELRLVK